MRFHLHVKGSPIDATDRDGDPNDDHFTGEDFDGLVEALAAYDALCAGVWPAGWDWQLSVRTHFPGCYVVLIDDHQALVLETKLPGRRDRDDGGDWRRERAMEAGMLHGCDAYNDAMGY